MPKKIDTTLWLDDDPAVRGWVDDDPAAQRWVDD
jgi:hypothetical protein